ncbi:MAG TPA: hypothetical protein PLI09_28300 [Candidatus Hydrogenedentes bacterium]|nr:hypothetical protein [Candidatus Hydrogenedentota bacterium]
MEQVEHEYPMQNEETLLPALVGAWAYRTFSAAPELHQNICYALAAGEADHVIARCYAVDLDFVKSVQTYPVMQDWIIAHGLARMQREMRIREK